MPFKQFDRRALRIKPLAQRKNRVHIEEGHVSPDSEPRALSSHASDVIGETVQRIRTARENGRPRIMAFGAHAVKNGLAPVLIELVEDGWITHLATNGAGIIHDWEFAFHGQSSEDVRENVARGEFGAWEETGYFLNLALIAGAYEGLGYGESIGALVETEGLTIPSEAMLRQEAIQELDRDPSRAAAAMDFLEVVRSWQLKPGRIEIPHPFKRFGLQAAAWRLKKPFTGHPMIGHDIIYIHPMNHCAAIGRAAQRDFLAFAESVRQLDGGVYLSVGSAVMSPMIFEKSMAMAQNRALQEGPAIDNHFIVVVDLAQGVWDWSQGEPPEDRPDYYQRWNKTFSRMGGALRQVSADNRDFLLGLYQTLAG